MRRSNYYIVAGPTGGRPGNPLWFVSAGITPEFHQFLLEQEPDSEKYEELGLQVLNMSGYPEIDKEYIESSFMEGTICGWERGLMTRVQVPGNAACIGFETSPELRYSSHNLAYDSQALTISVVLQRYFFDMELNIPKQ
jgi:hypothetical protein